MTMEKINVTATFDTQGNIIPLSVQRYGQTLPVISTGRDWIDEEGHHILVMVRENVVTHLLFVSGDGLWYLIQHDDSDSSV
jgi:hypothetical protein